MNQSGTSSAISAMATLIVGLALAFALWSGLTTIATSNTKMAEAVASQRFWSSDSGGINNHAEGIGPLAGNRFAVVKDYAVSVYAVDAQGKLHRTDDIDPSFEPMRKASRRVEKAAATP
jgi:hypothetical protein